MLKCVNGRRGLDDAPPPCGETWIENKMTDKKFPVTDEIREAMALIRRGTDTFLIEEEFEQKLARSKATGEPLR